MLKRIGLYNDRELLNQLCVQTGEEHSVAWS